MACGLDVTSSIASGRHNVYFIFNLSSVTPDVYTRQQVQAILSVFVHQLTDFCPRALLWKSYHGDYSCQMVEWQFMVWTQKSERQSVNMIWGTNGCWCLHALFFRYCDGLISNDFIFQSVYIIWIAESCIPYIHIRRHELSVPYWTDCLFTQSDIHVHVSLPL